MGSQRAGHDLATEQQQQTILSTWNGTEPKEQAQYFYLQALGEPGFRSNEVDGLLKCMPFKKDKDQNTHWNFKPYVPI